MLSNGGAIVGWKYAVAILVDARLQLKQTSLAESLSYTSHKTRGLMDTANLQSKVLETQN